MWIVLLPFVIAHQRHNSRRWLVALEGQRGPSTSMLSLSVAWSAQVGGSHGSRSGSTGHTSRTVIKEEEAAVEHIHTPSFEFGNAAVSTSPVKRNSVPVILGSGARKRSVARNSYESVSHQREQQVWPPPVPLLTNPLPPLHPTTRDGLPTLEVDACQKFAHMGSLMGTAVH